MNVVHLSDTHFGTDDPTVVGALLRCLEDFDTELVIVSGDITQRAYSKEFKAAKKFIDGLPAKNIIMLFRCLIFSRDSFVLFITIKSLYAVTCNQCIAAMNYVWSL